MRRDDLCPAETPVFLIPVDMIDVPTDRVRSLKRAQAEAIGAAIVADGQYDPITVAQLPGSERFLLVDGLHRLEGCRLESLPFIEARIGLPQREARVRHEVLSGIVRADHDVFDRAAQMAALAAMAREKAGKPAIGDLRKLNGFLSIAEIEKEADADLAIVAKSMHWSEETADQMGISARSARRYAVLTERFTPEMIALLREKGLASELVPLTRLAALSPAMLEQAIAMIADGSVKTIAELFAPEEVAAPTVFKKKTDAYLNFLRTKASDRQRAMLLFDLRAEYHDDGQRKSAKGAAK